jgi:hypothetical protein
MMTRHIDLFCTPQSADAETSAAAPNGGDARPLEVGNLSRSAM